MSVSKKAASSKLEHPCPYSYKAEMDRWKFVLCPLLLMLSKSIAREVETLEQLNEKMLKWHNELRTKVLKCKLEGQPPAKVMPNLVSQIIIYAHKRLFAVKTYRM